YYPEVKEQEEQIMKLIKVEEERFNETLNDGLARLEEIIEEQKAANSKIVPGTDVFKLYDTYGFPKELTEEYVEDYGFTIDDVGFEAEMEAQRSRAREARDRSSSMQVQDELLSQIKADSTFIGYDHLTTETTIESILDEEDFTDKANEGEIVTVVLKETPFYAESGGQVADLGNLVTANGKAKVLDVQKAPNGQNIHRVEVVEGTIEAGASVTATVDADNRVDITKNHTATHLLHQALRDVLGEHIHQAGSLVKHDRLRFDFTHFEAVNDNELEKIEQIVNEKIWANIPVVIETMDIDAAKELGAMALFGEKYGDVVRVVQLDDYSIELCGGIHVNNSAEIGLFKIVSEAGIGAGTRRTEAVTSKEAYTFMKDKLAILTEAASLLKTKDSAVVEKVHALQDEMKELARENESLQQKASNEQSKELIAKVERLND